MKKITVILFSFLYLACGPDAEKPKRLLSEDEMVNILYDLSLLQAISSGNPAQLDSSRVDVKTYVFKKYSIDSLTLVQNQKYYAADMEKYQKLHKRVSERLVAEKTPLDSLAKKQDASKKRQRELKQKALTPSAK